MTKMARPSTPKPPAGLQPRGRRFWREVCGRYELEVDETELLVETCRLLDLCEALEAEDPAGTALHRSRQALARLLAQLQLPESSVLSPRSARAQTANTARWSQPRSGSDVSDAAREAARARWHPAGA